MNLNLNVKPFQETLYDGYCGPASLKIVLDYYGLQKSEKELAELCGWKKNVGVDDRGIKKAAETLGFKVEIKENSSFEDIEKWLERGVPVIVDWFTAGRNDYPYSEMADGHSSVVTGLDDGFIYLQDPEIGGIRKIKREDFLRVWFDFRGDYLKPEELIIRQIIAVYK
jgi:ABC-type bacteriocin/lantibiotic exporter with double-glycine peptidase domain